MVHKSRKYSNDSVGPHPETESGKYTPNTTKPEEAGLELKKTQDRPPSKHTQGSTTSGPQGTDAVPPPKPQRIPKRPPRRATPARDPWFNALKELALKAQYPPLIPDTVNNDDELAQVAKQVETFEYDGSDLQGTLHDKFAMWWNKHKTPDTPDAEAIWRRNYDEFAQVFIPEACALNYDGKRVLEELTQSKWATVTPTIDSQEVLTERTIGLGALPATAIAMNWAEEVEAEQNQKWGQVKNTPPSTSKTNTTEGEVDPSGKDVTNKTEDFSQWKRPPPLGFNPVTSFQEARDKTKGYVEDSEGSETESIRAYRRGKASEGQTTKRGQDDRTLSRDEKTRFKRYFDEWARDRNCLYPFRIPTKAPKTMDEYERIQRARFNNLNSRERHQLRVWTEVLAHRLRVPWPDLRRRLREGKEPWFEGYPQSWWDLEDLCSQIETKTSGKFVADKFLKNLKEVVYDKHTKTYTYNFDLWNYNTSPAMSHPVELKTALNFSPGKPESPPEIMERLRSIEPGASLITKVRQPPLSRVLNEMPQSRRYKQRLPSPTRGHLTSRPPGLVKVPTPTRPEDAPFRKVANRFYHDPNVRMSFNPLDTLDIRAHKDPYATVRTITETKDSKPGEIIFCIDVYNPLNCKGLTLEEVDIVWAKHKRFNPYGVSPDVVSPLRFTPKHTELLQSYRKRGLTFPKKVQSPFLNDERNLIVNLQFNNYNKPYWDTRGDRVPPADLSNPRHINLDKDSLMHLDETHWELLLNALVTGQTNVPPRLYSQFVETYWNRLKQIKYYNQTVKGRPRQLFFPDDYPQQKGYNQEMSFVDDSQIYIPPTRKLKPFTFLEAQEALRDGALTAGQIQELWGKLAETVDEAKQTQVGLQEDVAKEVDSLTRRLSTITENKANIYRELVNYMGDGPPPGQAKQYEQKCDRLLRQVEEQEVLIKDLEGERERVMALATEKAAGLLEAPTQPHYQTKLNTLEARPGLATQQIAEVRAKLKPQWVTPWKQKYDTITPEEDFSIFNLWDEQSASKPHQKGTYTSESSLWEHNLDRMQIERFFWNNVEPPSHVIRDKAGKITRDSELSDESEGEPDEPYPDKEIRRKTLRLLKTKKHCPFPPRLILFPTSREIDTYNKQTAYLPLAQREQDQMRYWWAQMHDNLLQTREARDKFSRTPLIRNWWEFEQLSDRLAKYTNKDLYQTFTENFADNRDKDGYFLYTVAALKQHDHVVDLAPRIAVRRKIRSDTPYFVPSVQGRRHSWLAVTSEAKPKVTQTFPLSTIGYRPAREIIPEEAPLLPPVYNEQGRRNMCYNVDQLPLFPPQPTGTLASRLGVAEDEEEMMMVKPQKLDTKPQDQACTSSQQQPRTYIPGTDYTDFVFQGQNPNPSLGRIVNTKDKPKNRGTTSSTGKPQVMESKNSPQQGGSTNQTIPRSGVTQATSGGNTGGRGRDSSDDDEFWRRVNQKEWGDIALPPPSNNPLPIVGLPILKHFPDGDDVKQAELYLVRITENNTFRLGPRHYNEALVLIPPANFWVPQSTFGVREWQYNCHLLTPKGMRRTQFCPYHIDFYFDNLKRWIPIQIQWIKWSLINRYAPFTALEMVKFLKLIPGLMDYQWGPCLPTKEMTDIASKDPYTQDDLDAWLKEITAQHARKHGLENQSAKLLATRRGDPRHRFESFHFDWPEFHIDPKIGNITTDKTVKLISIFGQPFQILPTDNTELSKGTKQFSKGELEEARRCIVTKDPRQLQQILNLVCQVREEFTTYTSLPNYKPPMNLRNPDYIDPESAESEVRNLGTDQGSVKDLERPPLHASVSVPEASMRTRADANTEGTAPQKRVEVPAAKHKNTVQAAKYAKWFNNLLDRNMPILPEYVSKMLKHLQSLEDRGHHLSQLYEGEKAEVAALRQQNQRLRDTVRSTELELSQAEHNYNSVQAECDEADGQRARWKRKYDEAQDNLKRLHNRYKYWKAKENDRGYNEQEANKKLAERDAEIVSLTTRLGQVKELLAPEHRNQIDAHEEAQIRAVRHNAQAIGAALEAQMGLTNSQYRELWDLKTDIALQVHTENHGETTLELLTEQQASVQESSGVYTRRVTIRSDGKKLIRFKMMDDYEDDESSSTTLDGSSSDQPSEKPQGSGGHTPSGSDNTQNQRSEPRNAPTGSSSGTDTSKRKRRQSGQFLDNPGYGSSASTSTPGEHNTAGKKRGEALLASTATNVTLRPRSGGRGCVVGDLGVADDTTPDQSSGEEDFKLLSPESAARAVQTVTAAPPKRLKHSTRY